MRLAGLLTATVAIAAAAVFCLLPTSVAVLGTTYSCGPPVAEVIDRAVDDVGDDLAEDKCFDQSVPRVGVAAVIASLGLAAGVGLIAASGSSIRREPQADRTAHAEAP